MEKNNSETSKSKKGFTLIELIVVIAVLAILAALAVPAYNGLREQANRQVAEANTRMLYEAYKATCAAHPEAVNKITGNYIIIYPLIFDPSQEDFEDALFSNIGENFQYNSITVALGSAPDATLAKGPVVLTLNTTINGKSYSCTYFENPENNPDGSGRQIVTEPV